MTIATSTTPVAATISVTAADLLRALTATRPGVSRRPALAILAAVVLETTGSTLTLSTLNQDTAVSARVRLSEAAPTLRVAVSHANLLAAVKEVHKTAAVSVTVTENALALLLPSGAFTFPLLAVGEFPPLPTTAGTPALTASAVELAARLGAVAKSASTDMTLPVLCCACLNLTPGQPAFFEATDRYRITEWTAPASSPVWAGEARRVLLSARTLAVAAKELARHDKGAAARLDVGEEWTHLSTEEVTVSLRHFDGGYPRLAPLWPAAVDVKHARTLEPKPLAAAVKQVAAQQDNREPVRVRLGEEVIDVRIADTTQHARVTITHPGANLDGTNTQTGVETALNPLFLLDVLAAFTGLVVFSGVAAGRPWCFTGDTSDTGVRSLLMPVRLADNG